LAAVLVLTGLVSSGMRRSNWANMAIVSVTLLSLAAFVVTGLPTLTGAATGNLTPFFKTGEAGAWGGLGNLLQATALMFVAYTGYGRIATLGEEVRDPRRTIPRAILATLAVTSVLYGAVAFVSVGSVGASTLYGATTGEAAPLETVARSFAVPGVRWVVAVGAVTAMLGVLLNLILGLSRVLLAMGRRGDMPKATATLDPSGSTPRVAVLTVGLLIAGLVTFSSIKTAWSFSAFTVLVYYAITNLAALKLKPEDRLYPRWVSWCGLGGCLFLAFWVEPRYWITGLIVLSVGLLWHLARRRLSPGVRSEHH
jgi:APA family basic amino acid/polyamine antiporter